MINKMTMIRPMSGKGDKTVSVSKLGNAHSTNIKRLTA